MKKFMAMLYGMAAVAALTLGCFVFNLNPFLGTLFATMAMAFIIIAIIIATTQED